LLGGSVNIIRHGFKNSIALSRISYAFGTRAFRLAYEADFLNVMKNWDLYFDARYHGPSFIQFAGLGNETTRPEDDPNFYRQDKGDLPLSRS
jgi:hypothetical protein